MIRTMILIGSLSIIPCGNINKSIGTEIVDRSNGKVSLEVLEEESQEGYCRSRCRWMLKELRYRFICRLLRDRSIGRLLLGCSSKGDLCLPSHHLWTLRNSKSDNLQDNTPSNNNSNNPSSSNMSRYHPSISSNTIAFPLQQRQRQHPERKGQVVLCSGVLCQPNVFSTSLGR